MQVLLLDEITVDLDVLGRADLMDYLRSETEERGATIIYVTISSLWSSWGQRVCFRSAYKGVCLSAPERYLGLL